MAPGLVILWSGTAPLLQVLPLPATVGRETVAGDTLLSRTHCRIALEDDRFSVIDLGSRNGTFVDSERVAGTRRQLPPGTVVRTGTTVGVLARDADAFAADISECSARDVVRHLSYVEKNDRLAVDASVAEWFLQVHWHDVGDLIRVICRAVEHKQDAGGKTLRRENIRAPKEPNVLYVWSHNAVKLRLGHITSAVDEKPGYVFVIGSEVAVAVDDPRRHLADGEKHPAVATLELLAAAAHELGVTDKLNGSLASWALERKPADLAAMRDALRDNLAGKDVEPFARLFERIFHHPPPFVLPDNYAVLASQRLRGRLVETMIGSGTGQTLLAQADVGAVQSAPVGWLQTGFWGHGVNSYAFYFGQVTERSRLYLRLRYGDGAYERDPERQRAQTFAMLVKYLALAETLPVKHVTLVQSLEGAHWRIERLDGSLAEMEHPRDEYFSSLDTFDFEAIARGAAEPSA